MVTEIPYVLLIFAVAGQRLWELRHSAQNEQLLLAQGAVEHAPQQMTWMRLLHGAWLWSCAVEVLLLDRPFVLSLAAIALGVFALGQFLRISAIRALGWRWSVKILTLPGRGPVRRGIYRHMRHPNYLGVVLEIAALPLVHGAWLTSAAFTAANAVLLWHRIRAEEAALEDASRPSEEQTAIDHTLVSRPRARRRAR